MHNQSNCFTLRRERYCWRGQGYLFACMRKRTLVIVRVEFLDCILLDVGVGNGTAATAQLAIEEAASGNGCSVSNLWQSEVECTHHLQTVCKMLIIVVV
jgi:hypothetical protein